MFTNRRPLQLSRRLSAGHKRMILNCFSENLSRLQLSHTHLPLSSMGLAIGPAPTFPVRLIHELTPVACAKAARTDTPQTD